MNRRTKEISQELSLQAERWCYDNLAGPTPAEWNDKFHQKFAELIVRECSAVANHFSDGHEVRQFDDSKRYLYFVDIGKVVLEHFGVEE